jgi:hypothetical protein
MAKNKSIFTVTNVLIALGIGIVISMVYKKKPINDDVDLDEALDTDVFEYELNSPLTVDSAGCPIDRYGPNPAAYLILQDKVLSKKVPAVFEYETVILQRRLNNKKACLQVDGFFGDATEKALKDITGSSSISLQTLNFYGI